MNFLALIEQKREGQALSGDDIKWLVQGFVHGAIPDYQMAAWLMAVYFRGLDAQETKALTLAMRDSGDLLHFPKDHRPLVDKHSTGGVGDKVSLPLAPLLAALGFRVPMISGRGLGITGGTLDKLESIPGFRTALSPEEIVSQVQAIGCVICGQTETMVPADKAIYALRDVTGTVPSIPLITASILSKKLAEGLDALILDVKFGNAAFMPDKESALELADGMVRLGNECGVNTRAVLSNMSVPLGRAVGNWLEVKEAVGCLDGCGPEDLQELVVDCAAHLLVQTSRADTLETARLRTLTCLASGEPRQKWEQMLAAQGANVAALKNKLAEDPVAPVVKELTTPKDGFVTQVNARLIGEVVRDLGGGRQTKNATVWHDVGIDELVEMGEAVGVASVLCRIHARNEAEAAEATARLRGAFQIGPNPPETLPLIEAVITSVA